MTENDGLCRKRYLYLQGTQKITESSGVEQSKNVESSNPSMCFKLNTAENGHNSELENRNVTLKMQRKK